MFYSRQLLLYQWYFRFDVVFTTNQMGSGVEKGAEKIIIDMNINTMFCVRYISKYYSEIE